MKWFINWKKKLGNKSSSYVNVQSSSENISPPKARSNLAACGRRYKRKYFYKPIVPLLLGLFSSDCPHAPQYPSLGKEATTVKDWTPRANLASHEAAQLCDIKVNCPVFAVSTALGGHICMKMLKIPNNSSWWVFYGNCFRLMIKLSW